MKFNYFLKSFALVALMALFVNVNAAEFRVANNATDADLVAVLAQANTDDVIFIDGWVNIEQTVVIDKNVIIRAGNTTNAGFDGLGETRMFELKPEFIPGKKLYFYDLGFMGGNAWANYVAGDAGDDGGGGAAKISGGGAVEFRLCYFDGNEARRGGAIAINGGDPANDDWAANTTMVSFIGCDAENNSAYSQGTDPGESRGGYLFVDGNADLYHERCKIGSNIAVGGRGGALCLFGNGTRRFFYCNISDNKAGKWDDTETNKVDWYGNVVGDGWEYEGAVAFITSGATIFESCGFAGNKSWSHSGLIRGWGDLGSGVTFINCTLSKNQSMHDRSPLWIGGSATYTFVNSIVAENIGQNQGNGAGFDFDGANVHLNLFNSVFVRNLAGGDGYVDLRNASDYTKQLTVKNSIIGLIQGTTTGLAAQDNPSIPTKSIINMYRPVPTMEAAPVADSNPLDISGIDFDNGLKYTVNQGSRTPYYLLLPYNAQTAIIAQLGDPALLAEEGDTMDYLFTPFTKQARTPAADGSITAAPTLATTQASFDDRTWRDGILPPTPDGIISPKLEKENISIITAANGMLGVNFSELKGWAKGTLLNIAGQEVEQPFNCMVVGKGFYPINVVPGMYILKVEIGGKTYAQKLVVTK